MFSLDYDRGLDKSPLVRAVRTSNVANSKVCRQIFLEYEAGGDIYRGRRAGRRRSIGVIIKPIRYVNLNFFPLLRTGEPWNWLRLEDVHLLFQISTIFVAGANPKKWKVNWLGFVEVTHRTPISCRGITRDTTVICGLRAFRHQEILESRCSR